MRLHARAQTGQKGVALVLVLWIVSLLTIMAGSFALTMRREASIIDGIKSDAQASAVAESGVAMAELMLLVPDDAKRWWTDGSIYQINYAGGSVRIRLLAENGKIDLNKADEALLLALISQAPVDEGRQTQLVNAILDWRDADDLVRIEGAEKKEYQEAGLSYQPRNKPFQSLEELQLVLGVNERIYDWLQDFVTVYSGQAKVNLQQASEEVLKLLPDLDAEAKEEYLQARRQRSANASKPISTQDPEQRPAAPAAGADGAITIISEALLDDGSTAMVNAIVKKSDSGQSSPFQILKWQRNYAGNASLFTDEMSELLVTEYAEPEFNR